MKSRWGRILTATVLAMFVNFMFSNVIFLHLHQDENGRAFLHSHPYLPKAPHHHDSHTLDLIAAFNSAANTALKGEPPALFAPAVEVVTLLADYADADVIREIAVFGLRGPPSLK